MAGAFVITFLKRARKVNGGVNGGVNADVDLLYKFIKENPGQRTINLAEALQRPFDTVEKWLRKLKKENKVEYRGSDKTGGYFVCL